MASGSRIGELIGDVIDMRIFQFTLLEVGNWVKADQSTGRIIHVPNGKVFTEGKERDERAQKGLNGAPGAGEQ